MSSIDQFFSKQHFLSATNPLATLDQRELERHALELMNTPAFKSAKKGTEQRWRELAGQSPTKEAWARFDNLLEEAAYANVLKALNGDSNHPRVIRIVMPPHDWFGMRVPGSRFGGGPGADQSYAIIPIDYGAHYRIRGHWVGEPPADHNYTLSGNAHFMNSLGTFQYDDIERQPDGSFTLSVGPEPGARNHIRTVPGTEYLFVRDCWSDWRQAATALTVERLDPPVTPPWTEDLIMRRAAQLMLDDAPPMFYWVRFYQNMERNVLTRPFLTDAVGGLVSQTVSFGRVLLDEDEALVVTIDPAGAAFHDVQLNDYWFNSIGDYYGRTPSYNNAQTSISADGTATYVISLEDPNIHNWIDPNGLRESLLVARWQRLPRDRQISPAISARLVKLRELDSAVPADVRRVTPSERRAQIKARLESYHLRLRDS